MKIFMKAIWAAVLLASAFVIAPMHSSAQAAPASTPTPPDKIMLSDLDIAVDYDVIGEVSAVVHQTAVFTKRPIMLDLDDALRAEAARVGADAVVKIVRYPGSAFNTKGFRATGVAIKFRPKPPQPVQQEASAASPESPAQISAPYAPPAPPAPTGPTPEAQIILSDQDITYRQYTVLGEVSAVVHQTSVFPKIPTRVTLDKAIRAEAAKLGADAVVKIHYVDGSGFTTKGFSGTGLAVKFR